MKKHEESGGRRGREKSVYFIDKVQDIHRVGRTARAGAEGRALMFLLPTETTFLKYLSAAKVPLNEFEFVESKLVVSIFILLLIFFVLFVVLVQALSLVSKERGKGYLFACLFIILFGDSKRYPNPHRRCRCQKLLFI